MKNVLLASVTTLVTLVLALVAIRNLAPRLAGVPIEVRYVQSSQEVPPFFKNAFERAGTNEEPPDPVTVVRTAGLQDERPGHGPADLLGFRNEAVPIKADVIAIGDSQTYGYGVAFKDTWPKQLEARLAGKSVYSMACGGWGPTQYVVMGRLADRFRPKAVIVAYYTGNDPHDAFAEAYNKPRWKSLRASTTLDKNDQPKAVWPIPDDDQWDADLGGGVRTVFTPGYRFASNDRSVPGVREGYAIIARTATAISDALQEVGARVVFTIIPTKELAYAERVRAAGLKPPAPYRSLIADEPQNIDELAALLRKVPRGSYVDVVKPLQRAALGKLPLYRADIDGHPQGPAFAVIAEALAAELSR